MSFSYFSTFLQGLAKAKPCSSCRLLRLLKISGCFLFLITEFSYTGFQSSFYLLSPWRPLPFPTHLTRLTLGLRLLTCSPCSAGLFPHDSAHTLSHCTFTMFHMGVLGTLLFSFALGFHAHYFLVQDIHLL